MTCGTRLRETPCKTPREERSREIHISHKVLCGQTAQCRLEWGCWGGARSGRRPAKGAPGRGGVRADANTSDSEGHSCSFHPAPVEATFCPHRIYSPVPCCCLQLNKAATKINSASKEALLGSKHGFTALLVRRQLQMLGSWGAQHPTRHPSCAQHHGTHQETSASCSQPESAPRPSLTPAQSSQVKKRH